MRWGQVEREQRYPFGLGRVPLLGFSGAVEEGPFWADKGLQSGGCFPVLGGEGLIGIETPSRCGPSPSRSFKLTSGRAEPGSPLSLPLLHLGKYSTAAAVYPSPGTRMTDTQREGLPHTHPHIHSSKQRVWTPVRSNCPVPRPERAGLLSPAPSPSKVSFGVASCVGKRGKPDSREEGLQDRGVPLALHESSDSLHSFLGTFLERLHHTTVVCACSQLGS